MRVLDLFSGIGGFALGCEWAGMETVAFCETDDFCRRWLAHEWPDIPCFPDIRELTGEFVDKIFGEIDLICGGFPCQPYSVAGKRRGASDDRDLWPEMFRVISEVRPRWVVGENTPGLDGLALDGIISDLESLGYETAPPFEIPACAVDAPHKRSRLFIVAHAAGGRWSDGGGEVSTTRSEGQAGRHSSERDVANARYTQRGSHNARGNIANGENTRGQESDSRAGERSEDVADPTRVLQGREIERPERERAGAAGQSVSGEDVDDTTRERHKRPRRARHRGPGFANASSNHWRTSETLQGRRIPEPGICLLAHGVPQRVAKLRGFGNSVVPQKVEQIARAIMIADNG